MSEAVSKHMAETIQTMEGLLDRMLKVIEAEQSGEPDDTHIGRLSILWRQVREMEELVENVPKELVTGKTPVCSSCGISGGADLIYGPDPYACELHGVYDPVWLCDGCAKESAKDI